MRDKITKPGIYQIPEADYHADKLTPSPSLSSSGARQLISECPAKFWAERMVPPEPSKALDVGSAAHEWLLEGDAWPMKFQVLPEDHTGTTKEGKARIASIKEAGLRPLKLEDFGVIKAMKIALEAHPFAGQAFKDGVAEQSIYWKDDQFGIWCRCRPDFLPHKHNIVADYKTTRSAQPEYLQKAMYDYGYHQQAEWYLQGIEALQLLDNPKFLFVFQEKTPPYVVTCVTPSEIALQWAAIQNQKAKEVFARCLEAGDWPGYADEIVTLDLPMWAEHRLMDRKDKGLFEIAYRAQAPLNAAE